MTAGGSRAAFRSRATRCGAVMLATTLAMAAAFLVASPARAADALVVSTDGSGTACTTVAPCPLFEARAQAASSGSDVALMPGTYDLPVSVEVGAFTLRPLVPGTRPVLRFTAGSWIYANNSSALIRDIRIESQALGATEWALRLQPGRGERLEVIAGGPLAGNGALLSDGSTLSDSTVWTASPNASALNTGNGGSTFRNVTALATGTNATGFFTNDSYTTTAANVTFQNTILRGPRYDLEAYSSTPAETIAISLDHSNYATSSVSGTHAALTDQGGRQVASPSFVDPAAGNLRQLSGSPTRNAGAAVPGLSATALDGQARVHGAAPDIGADEYVEAPPTSAVSVAKVTIKKRSGIAVIRLTLPVAGSVSVAGRGVKSAATTGGAATVVKVKVKPTKAGLKKLRKKGRLRTTLTVSWTPTAGLPGPQPSIPLVLKLKTKR